MQLRHRCTFFFFWPFSSSQSLSVEFINALLSPRILAPELFEIVQVTSIRHVDFQYLLDHLLSDDADGDDQAAFMFRNFAENSAFCACVKRFEMKTWRDKFLTSTFQVHCVVLVSSSGLSAAFHIIVPVIAIVKHQSLLCVSLHLSDHPLWI